MAANKGRSGGERSRARFMLVEFDGTSDDFQQLVQTFTQAVKAAPPVTQQPPRQASAIDAHSQAPDRPGLFDGVTSPNPAEAEDAPPPVPSASTKSNGGKRKHRTPTVLADLDLKGGKMPFEEFMERQAVENHSKRYLAIAWWFKEYRGVATVGADHIYTCYRYLGLSVPADVLEPFRKMKPNGWVTNGEDSGTYAINHVGEKHLSPVKK